jgi:hypothetical protein
MLYCKKSTLVCFVLGVILNVCSETTLSTCPVIINPLNTGQQIKLIPNQKVNEYAIALVCSTNTPVVVGGSKRCLTQSEDGPYISSLFQSCAGAPRNAGGATVLPTGKGQFRPILGNATVPPVNQVATSTYAPVTMFSSQQTQQNTPSSVPSMNPTLPPQSTDHTTDETTTPTPEVTEPEPTVSIPRRSGRRVTFDTTETSTPDSSVEETPEELSVGPDTTSSFDFTDWVF